jgi:hypothetical protein
VCVILIVGRVRAALARVRLTTKGVFLDVMRFGIVGVTCYNLHRFIVLCVHAVLMEINIYKIIIRIAVLKRPIYFKE